MCSLGRPPDPAASHATHLHIRVLCDPPQVFQHTDPRCGARVESGQRLASRQALSARPPAEQQTRTHGDNGILSLWTMRRCSISAAENMRQAAVRPARTRCAPMRTTRWSTSASSNRAGSVVDWEESDIHRLADGDLAQTSQLGRSSRETLRFLPQVTWPAQNASACIPLAYSGASIR